MANIAVISRLEFIDNCAPFALFFTQETATYEVKDTKTKSGHLYAHTLKFKIPGIGDHQRSVAGKLRLAKVIRIHDVNGLSVRLGREDLPVETVLEESIGGKVGSFRGFEGTVKWESREPAPIESFI